MLDLPHIDPAQPMPLLQLLTDLAQDLTVCRVALNELIEAFEFLFEEGVGGLLLLLLLFQLLGFLAEALDYAALFVYDVL
jgi:hypothetical protein